MAMFFNKEAFTGWSLKTDCSEKTGFSHEDLVDAVNRITRGQREFLIVESLRNGAFMQAASGNGVLHLEIRVDKVNGGFLIFASDGFSISETINILEDFITGKAMPDLNDGWYVEYEK